MNEWLELENAKFGNRLTWKKSTLPNSGEGLFACERKSGELNVAFAPHVVVGVFYGRVRRANEVALTSQAEKHDRAVTLTDKFMSGEVACIDGDRYSLANMINDGSAVRLPGRGGPLSLQNVRIYETACCNSWDSVQSANLCRDVGITPATVCLVATRTIMSGEELFTEYGNDFWAERTMVTDRSAAAVTEEKTIALNDFNDEENSQLSQLSQGSQYSQTEVPDTQPVQRRESLPRPGKPLLSRELFTSLDWYIHGLQGVPVAEIKAGSAAAPDHELELAAPASSAHVDGNRMIATLTAQITPMHMAFESMTTAPITSVSRKRSTDSDADDGKSAKSAKQ